MRACVSLIVLFTLALASQHATAADPKPLPPTYANVSYGPHERNVLDFWKADGDWPAALVDRHSRRRLGRRRQEAESERRSALARQRHFVRRDQLPADGHRPAAGPRPRRRAGRAVSPLEGGRVEHQSQSHRAHGRQRRGLHVDVALVSRRPGRSEVERSRPEAVDPRLRRRRDRRPDVHRPEGDRRLGRPERAQARHDLDGRRREIDGRRPRALRPAQGDLRRVLTL